MSEQFIQQAEPEDVFMALADETRLRILQALWESDTPTMTFSELREATGMRDSGQFSYHLDKLIGQFVTKSDDEYQLTQAGKHINGSIASGMYTAHRPVDPIVLDNPCRMCGGTQTLHYTDEIVHVECDSCPSSWEATVPPAVLADTDREEISQVVSQYFRAKLRHIADGFCLYCEGPLQPTVGPLTEMDVGASAEESDSDRPHELPVVQFDCQRCGAVFGVALDYGLLLAEPRVDRFYQEHGIDMRERPIWGLSELDPDEGVIERQDPIRASVTFRPDEAELTVVVDERFNVVDVDRD